MARPAACYAQRMARASITVTEQTAAALRAAKPTLSWVESRMLTVDDCIAYLLNYWLQNAPEARHLREASQAAAGQPAPATRRKSAASG